MPSKKVHNKMEPKIGDIMKVDPNLSGAYEWITGEVIGIEHNPFRGLCVAIKDSTGRIYWGPARYFKAA